MSEFVYSFRASVLAAERSYRLERDSLCWTRHGSAGGRIELRDLRRVRLDRIKMRGDPLRKQAWRIELRSRRGHTIALSPLHCVRFRRWEDRTASFKPFLQELLDRIKAANPQVEFDAPSRSARGPAGTCVQAMGGWAMTLLLHAVRRVDRRAVAAFGGYLMQTVGPYLSAHRVGRANLAGAYPDMPPGDIDRLMQKVWNNLGQVGAEFACVDQLTFDYPAGVAGADVLFDPETRARFDKLRTSGKPVLMFGAHLGNWELLGFVLTAVGMPAAILYRPPNIEFIGRTVIDIRAGKMARLVASEPGAVWQLMQAHNDRCNVGMLVDQYFADGVEVEMFGRRCGANPLIALLARQFDCPIHGGRVVRLPDGRFRVDLTEAVDPPRDRDGAIDIAGTMQTITSIIEGWVREYPEQWLWPHRRWR